MTATKAGRLPPAQLPAEAAQSSSPPGRAGGAARTALRFAPGAVAMVATVALLLFAATPAGDIARYAAYLGFALLLPGTVAHRALRGPQPTLLADLALGAATGLMLELLAWAAATALGVQDQLRWWPLLVLVPAALLRLRRRRARVGAHTFRPTRDPWSPWVGWFTCAAYLVAASRVAILFLRPNALPPKANGWYQDVYWHLSIAQELTRRVPPDVPQVAGRPLLYNWLPDAHFASASLVSGVDLPVVLGRLWALPVLAVVVGLLVAVTRSVSGSSSAGPLAVLLFVAPAVLVPWVWVYGGDPLSTASPSMLYGFAPLLLAVHPVVDVVRGRRIGLAWVVLLLGVAVSSGSKSSLLPVLGGGLVVALLAAVVVRRGRGGTLAAGALVLAAFVAARPVLVGGSAGSRIQALALLQWMRPWRVWTGQSEVPGAGGHTVPGLTVPGGALLAMMLVLAVLLHVGWVAPAVSLLGRGRHAGRSDPAVWLLAGVGGAGEVGLLVVAHPAESQLYFATAATPLLAVLAAWGVDRAVRTNELPRSARWTSALGVAVVGGAVAGTLVWRWVEPGLRVQPTRAQLPGGVVLSVSVALAALLAWLLLVVALRGQRLPPDRVRSVLVAFLCATLVATSLAPGLRSMRNVLRLADKAAPPVSATSPTAVTAAESVGAQWIQQHAGPDDVIATNLHCLEKLTVAGCDARSFWVSALTGRRTVVEGWGYTDEAQAAQGRGGLSFLRQPFDDPALLALNDGAFTSPTTSLLDELRDRHAVRWLYADSAAGPVSSRLGTLAELRWARGGVAVYQLRGIPAPRARAAAALAGASTPSR